MTIYALIAGMVSGGLTSVISYKVLKVKDYELEYENDLGAMIRFIAKWILLISGLGGVWVASIVTYILLKYQ